MLNKRISAIALSVLLAFSPMYSSVYVSSAAASENEAISQEAILDAALPDGSIPGAAMTDAAMTGESIPDETVLDESAPDEKTIDETLAEEAALEDTNQPEAGAASGSKDRKENECSIAPIEFFDHEDPAGGDDNSTAPEDNEDPATPVEDPCAVNGHTFGAWTVVTPPTTRTDGKSERTCSVCGATESKVEAHTDLKVKTVTISRSSATLLNGRSVQLWAKTAPADATTPGVTWKSSNPSVATVSAAGLVSAKRRGTTTITCTAKDGGGAKASCKITVNLSVAKISLDRTSLALNKGRVFTLKATVSPAAATNKAVTWKSSNTKVATVTSAGQVKFKARGTATITCTAKDGSGASASCKVTVRIPVSVINLGRSSATLLKGRTLDLRAGVGPASANNKTVSWKSSNTSVATVSPTGTVTATGKGTAVITCSARDGSGVKSTCRITVTLPAPAPAPARSSDDSGGSGGNSGGGSGGGNSGSGGGSGDSGSGGGYVWISATGSKYHNKNNCGTMNPSKASKVTLEEARRRGLDPCRKCFP